MALGMVLIWWELVSRSSDRRGHAVLVTPSPRTLLAGAAFIVIGIAVAQLR
jgi:hypothetical protein